ncbi:chaplin family protein [Actinomadura chibensis]|uniref:chaplin family protein n=1 Tax=Actinomadura chibensis TaxID=392828 RepID=UPI00082F0CCD|nr:chaplin family protein [Actinomadura chibensis]
MLKKLAATGALGLAVASSALVATPAHASAYGGDHGHCHHKCHPKGHHHGQFNGNHTSGNFSILGGNQVNAPISIPVNVCGNAIAVIGFAAAQCKGGASVENG